MARHSGTPHHANMYLRPALYRMVTQPNPKVEIKKAKPQSIGVPHLDDEAALAMIREVKAGMKRKDAAEKYDCSMGTINNLMTGVNRGHLLRMVEEGMDSPRIFRPYRKGNP